jgi:small subunit ribosomal protein S19
MPREFYFRGKTLKELMEMSIEEFAKLVPARQRRSLLRSGLNKKLEKKIEKALMELKQGKNPKPIRTHLRDTIVVPKMIGLSFAIYNGKEFVVRKIEPEMLGHYFGELVLTRKKLVHGKAGIGATRSSTAITARG